MASHIMSDEERKDLEKIAASAEPYDDDDPELNIIDDRLSFDPKTRKEREEKDKRYWATIAKLCLEGKL